MYFRSIHRIKLFNIYMNSLRFISSNILISEVLNNLNIQNPNMPLSKATKLNHYTKNYFYSSISGVDNSYLSLWHNIPLIHSIDNSRMVLNYINEIPKQTNIKYELSKYLPYNPIIQDFKVANQQVNYRQFKYKPLPFNYGFLPLTWESPLDNDPFISNYANNMGLYPVFNSDLSLKKVDLSTLKGDGDALDVVEISTKTFSVGQIVPVEVLGVLCLIDQGEVDWKIIVHHTSNK